MFDLSKIAEVLSRILSDKYKAKVTIILENEQR